MQVLNIFHVLIAIGLIAFVLIQKGQGATAGAAFGSGASGTVFGARGAGNFLSRTTWVLAALFCTISLVMAVMVSRMMDNPEVGLGVISDQPTAIEQQVSDNTSNEVLVNPEQPVVTDMPAVQPSADDVPAMDSAAADAFENAADDLPPVASGEEDPDSGTDGN
jgi:preprotein translocase subunit SecG